MRKCEELSDPNSCMSRARDDEMTFVMLERDIASAGTVLDWRERRIRFGKNKRSDPQMIEALEWVKTVLPVMKERLTRLRIALACLKSQFQPCHQEEAELNAIDEDYFRCLRTLHDEGK